MNRAGIPRAHRSGALDLLLVHPELAAQVLAGGCTVHWCATCAAWLPGVPNEEHAGHQVQGFDVPFN
ncbi:hypothetical protein [Myxococcus eversor]|uniref:hypothetical protein n=1 Tax=Myxococcus eversor TaxID=2709661 RepID=UPI001F085BE8|nr:hypothetical protein [Myxococcus eversor]